jgi:hypothetical protein
MHLSLKTIENSPSNKRLLANSIIKPVRLSAAPDPRPVPYGLGLGHIR